MYHRVVCTREDAYDDLKRPYTCYAGDNVSHDGYKISILFCERATVPAEIETLRVPVNLHKVGVSFPSRPKKFSTPFNQALVHGRALRHGLEKRIVLLAEVQVEKAVRRKTPTARRAEVAVRSLVVCVVLRGGRVQTTDRMATRGRAKCLAVSSLVCAMMGLRSANC